MTERRGCCVFAPMAADLDKDDYNDKDTIGTYYNDEDNDIENDVNDDVDDDKAFKYHTPCFKLILQLYWWYYFVFVL